MKHRQWKQFLSITLVVCMIFTMAIPSLAGPIKTGKDANFYSRWNDYLQSLLEKLENQYAGSEEEEETEEAEEVPAGDSTVTLVEDASTVENGEMLRASTYTLRSSSTDAQAEDTVLKYFPITLYDYDADTINSATHAYEVENTDNLTQWQGLYFSGGDPAAESYTYTLSAQSHSNLTWAQVQNGTYYADEKCIQKVEVMPKTEETWNGPTEKSLSEIYNDDTAYYYGVNHERVTVTYNKYAYYRYTASTSSGTISTSRDGSTTIDVYTHTAATIGYTATVNGYTYTLNSTDTSAAFPVSPLYTVASSDPTDTLEYAAWNWWNKKSGNNNNGQKTYTGLAASTLDANKDIVFNVPDAGIFTADETYKTVYTNVELPFVYESGMYTFNAAEKGVYFHEDTKQQSDGTAGDNTRLYYNKDSTQSNSGNYGDGSSTVWAPFNDSTSFTESAMNYHFGMRATIPFNMTSDGHVQEGVADSGDIVFSFSGDDDVWVFIDGQLVIDLGGIHNRLDATINFAENTVTYSESNNLDTATGSYNDADFALEQTLFGNLISQDRITFAATDSHELTIFYLERGKGSSNGQIQFNLPVKDTVSVQKIIDGVATVKNNSVTFDDLSSLSESQITALNNLNFSFTLYKDNTAVANETYLLLNANGQVIATPSTDANGQFMLKNGQTAKFTGTISTDGDDYHVVENIKNGFIYTGYSYSLTAAGSEQTSNTDLNNYTYYKTSGAYYVTDMTHNAGILESTPVTVLGGEESEDALSFVCRNYMNASLPTPSAIPADDKVVIDYGLNVDIDLFSNDLYVGDSAAITFPGYTAVNNGVYTAEFGTFTYNSTTHKITYTLNKQLTGVEVIDYTLTATASTESGTGTAKVYIIPATVMYYEENFSDMVTYTGSGWQDGLVTESTYTNTLQEPGVVGTHDDSPYGSDAAYLNDSHDSNGTSKYAGTTGGAVKFSYTFTGTGTSFFGRTTANSGYMKVEIKGGSVEKSIYRDTVYLNTNGLNISTLYNIPLYTIDELPYGTYTVTATIAKSTDTNGFGSDFWLDGIRVYQPLNSEDTNYTVATSAYSTDAEANMVNVTLRNKLISEADLNENDELVYTNGSFAVLTDNTGAITTLEQYVSDGPKEEVYLYNGQSISFSLYDWDPNTNKLYLGMKAPSGSATVTLKDTSITLSNAADCYYEVSSYAAVTTDDAGIKTATFTITAGTNSLVSVTNIKVTGNAEFTIIQSNTDIDVDGGEGEGEDPASDINE